MNIVVVDDEPELLDMVGAVLECEGHEVTAFAHPLDAARLRPSGRRTDIFLLDLMLPEISGIALATRLHDTGFEGTPKIAMSASLDMLRLARESELFNDTLEKPFDIDALLGCVDRYAFA
jgi:CheY-like chemotaxis protein